MKEKERVAFCADCRNETGYVLKKKNIKRTIRDKDYIFNITVAICQNCGNEMSIPGLIDKNIQEIDEQYRAAEGLISIKDIENLMTIYHIGKAPLSYTLGFGEITVTRYLSGQMPSKEYSDIIRHALSSPQYMRKLLDDNKYRLAASAYEKALASAIKLEQLFSVSEKMLGAISYIFNELEEVTPLMLQKLLYFIQGVFLAIYNRPIFVEDCEAWVHGPVYPKVYDLFKDFKYNPIDDARFSIMKGMMDILTEEEKRIINLVVGTFGMYGGKTLETITHGETPWQKARLGFADDVSMNVIVTKDSIKEYYDAVNIKYKIETVEGLKAYINNMLGIE